MWLSFTDVVMNVRDESPDEVYDGEGRRKSWLVIELVYQRVTMEPPDFLRIFLNVVERITGT